MQNIYDVIDLARQTKMVYSGEMIVSVQREGNVLYTYFALGIERNNPTVITIETICTDDIVMIGDGITQFANGAAIVTGYDIYDIISIFGEHFDGYLHVTVECTNYDDAHTVGYILSELSEYCGMTYSAQADMNNAKYIAETIDVIKEESEINPNTGNIIFFITIKQAEDYLEILEIFKNIFSQSLRRFDKNVRFDLGFGADSNPVLYIVIDSIAHTQDGKGDFKTSRGLVYPDYEW